MEAAWERSYNDTLSMCRLWTAWALATKAGYAKAQIICEDTDIIELETKALDNSIQLRYNMDTQRRE